MVRHTRAGCHESAHTRTVVHWRMSVCTRAISDANAAGVRWHKDQEAVVRQDHVTEFAVASNRAADVNGRVDASNGVENTNDIIVMRRKNNEPIAGTGGAAEPLAHALHHDTRVVEDVDELVVVAGTDRPVARGARIWVVNGLCNKKEASVKMAEMRSLAPRATQASRVTKQRRARGHVFGSASAR